LLVSEYHYNFNGTAIGLKYANFKIKLKQIMPNMEYHRQKNTRNAYLHSIITHHINYTILYDHESR